VAQGEGPEFEPWYCKREKKEKENKKPLEASTLAVHLGQVHRVC
jgi:hypothetical protein